MTVGFVLFGNDSSSKQYAPARQKSAVTVWYSSSDLSQHRWLLQGKPLVPLMDAEMFPDTEAKGDTISRKQSL